MWTAIKLFLSEVNPKVWLYLGIAVVVAGMIGWYKHNETVLAELNRQVTVGKLAVESRDKVIASMEADVKQIKIINKNLEAARIADAAQKDNLQRKLSKLEKVTLGRKSLVEKKINAASKERNRCFALATGAIPLKDERNSVCPQLLPK